MRYLLLSIALLFTTLVYSQNDTVVYEKSLLWEITGNGLESPSYIFGTIHLLPEEDYFFTEKMKESFDKCEVLVLEIDMDIPLLKQLKLAKMAMIPDGKTLSDYMTEEDYGSFSAYILDTLKLKQSKFNQINMIKPLFSSSLILVELMPKTITYELELSKMAEKKGMEIKGLETVEYQMNVINKISMEEQVQMLISQGFSGNPLDEFYELTAIYKDQDINKMLALSDEDDLINKYEHDLINKRNSNWIPVIEKMISKNSTFFAVGAMHLPGEFGVLYLLKEKGYQIKAILD